MLTTGEYTGVRLTSKPPEPSSSVGLLPSSSRSSSLIWKYGTFVPSALVAKCCSTFSPSEGNRAAADLITSAVLGVAVPDSWALASLPGSSTLASLPGSPPTSGGSVPGVPYDVPSVPYDRVDGVRNPVLIIQ